VVRAKELRFASVSQLGTWLRSGQTTAVELATHSLERLNSVGRDLNAVVTLTSERALDEAARADAELARGEDRGPLHGIPYGAKDLLAVEGYPTTWGAAPLRDQRLPGDATVITLMREAGAVLTAKLAMVELAGGFGYDQPNAALTGPGLNAWDKGRWAGGSSSGSGSAVAAGCVPLAIGTETWGSIHVPAAFNGITGFRPTFGLVSRHGAMALSWSMDKIGPMARSATDCETMLLALAGRDSGDAATLARPPFQSNPKRSGFRFATLADAEEGVEPDVLGRYQDALAEFARLGSIEQIVLPELPYNAAASTVIAAEAASAFEEFLEAGLADGLTAPEDRVTLLAGFSLPATDYLRALRLRGRASQALAQAFADYDAIITPGYRSVATEISMRFSEEPDFFGLRTIDGAANLCGLPGLIMPAGPGAQGLPTAVCLTGRADADAVLLAAGQAFQAATEWHVAVPPI
jgi:aspartyl-tRNA(Asn)/glutamyl-tRNA(Gln) amidotransferase subunit A